jgi:hypothetical protein
MTKTVEVIFRNGHTAKTDIDKVATDEFTALCAMLYQLPQKEITDED